jgi:hypothetical protein
VEVMAQAAGVNSGGPNNSGPVHVPPQAQPMPSQKPDMEGNNAQQPPDGEIIYCNISIYIKMNVCMSRMHSYTIHPIAMKLR